MHETFSSQLFFCDLHVCDQSCRQNNIYISQAEDKDIYIIYFSLAGINYKWLEMQNNNLFLC